MPRSMAEALRNIGLSPEDAEFDLAIARYLNAGGTIQRARERLDIAARRLPVLENTANQQSSDVTRQNRNGGGRPATVARDTNATPVREPTSRQRGVAGELSKVLAVTVLDTFKIRDGRPIGNVRIGEVERLRAANVMEASIFRQIQHHVAGYTDGTTKIRDLITDKDFQRIQQRAAEVVDAS